MLLKPPPPDRLPNEPPEEWLAAARAQWEWRGVTRPDFAVIPDATKGQVSVWDFPRPPVIVGEARAIIIHWGDIQIANTTKAVAVLETSHPPTFYLPWDDVDRALFIPGRGSSYCEWKGLAQYWTLAQGEKRLTNVAWGYPAPLAGAEILANRLAFYADSLRCTVGGETVAPQPGGFYGGWVTPELVGPFNLETAVGRVCPTGIASPLET